MHLYLYLNYIVQPHSLITRHNENRKQSDVPTKLPKYQRLTGAILAGCPSVATNDKHGYQREFNSGSLGASPFGEINKIKYNGRKVSRQSVSRAECMSINSSGGGGYPGGGPYSDISKWVMQWITVKVRIRVRVSCAFSEAFCRNSGLYPATDIDLTTTLSFACPAT